MRATTSHRWGFPCFGRSSCTYMPTPIPRRDRWVHLSLLPHTTTAFPEIPAGRLSQIGLSRPAQRSLTFRPTCSLNRPRRSVTSEASTDSLPPPPLRLLPAGATRRRVGIAPTENRRLCTAHSILTSLAALSRRTVFDLTWSNSGRHPVDGHGRCVGQAWNVAGLWLR